MLNKIYVYIYIGNQKTTTVTIIACFHIEIITEFQGIQFELKKGF